MCTALSSEIALLLLLLLISLLLWFFVRLRSLAVVAVISLLNDDDEDGIIVDSLLSVVIADMALSLSAVKVVGHKPTYGSEFAAAVCVALTVSAYVGGDSNSFNCVHEKGVTG